MEIEGNFFLLKGKVQHYDWGGFDFIPFLIGMENPQQLPFAEYWMGAHENNSSDVIVNDKLSVPLNVLIHKDPEVWLGKEIFKTHQKLPYLMKVLDVREMLSIQVHPDKESAAREFKRENEEGITLQSPQRNYKDDNQKLELVVALNGFWLLHGFKPAEKLIEILTVVPELNSFIHIFNVAGYRGLYSHVMELPQPSVNAILYSLVDRVVELYQSGSLQKDQEDYWAAKTAITFNKNADIDRGIFSIYFLNLFMLNKGEAVFQDAGVLHAYLQGRNIEIMSNSDNVLRGGLTVKHIDVGELMKHVLFKKTVPHIIKPEKQNTGEEDYKTGCPDFLLKRYTLKNHERSIFNSNTTEILFVIEGNVGIMNNSKRLRLSKGESVVVMADQMIGIDALADSEILRATVPIQNRE